MKHCTDARSRHRQVTDISGHGGGAVDACQPEPVTETVTEPIMRAGGVQLPLLYDNGHVDTQRSNMPVAAKNSAKNTSWPFGVAAACSPAAPFTGVDCASAQPTHLSSFRDFEQPGVWRASLEGAPDFAFMVQSLCS